MAQAGPVVPLRKAQAEMDQVVGWERVGAHGAPSVPGGVLRASRRPASLAVDCLTRRYGAITALDAVSFAIAPGELIAVVGYSGSGKSTLLRLLAGLEQPSAGTIAIDGRLVSGPSVFVPPEERGVGMMFQDYALFPHLSVIRNVTFGLRRMRADAARTIARRALERVGLADRENDYPHMLSGGEQQRVALARALVPEPGVLLMDEPFSNLDRRTRDLVREETAMVLRESGATAVLVTHDHDDAMLLADRIMLMRAGGIVQTGTAEDLYRRPASLTVARFFSEFNELEGVCRSGVVATPLGTFPARGMADGGKAVICLRQSDLSVGAAGGDGCAGTVVSRSFLGDALLLLIGVPGLTRPLQVRAPLQADIFVGDEVALRPAVDHALVFPAEG